MEEETRKTIDTFNRTARKYHEKTKDLDLPLRFVKMFSGMLPKRSRILDAGCGPGRDAKQFSDMGFDVVGIDLAEKMIEIARSYATDAEFEVMDIRHLDFKESSFDGIWFNASLINIRKQEARGTINEMHRVMGPGGLLYINVKEGKGEGMEEDHRFGGLEKYCAYYSRDEVISILEIAGFEIEKIITTPRIDEYYTHPIIRIFCRKSLVV